MHLSFLSDTFLSDSLHDHGAADDDRPFEQAFIEGLTRGLMALVLLAAPFVVMFGGPALSKMVGDGAFDVRPKPMAVSTASHASLIDSLRPTGKLAVSTR